MANVKDNQNLLHGQSFSMCGDRILNWTKLLNLFIFSRCGYCRLTGFNVKQFGEYPMGPTYGTVSNNSD